MFGSSPVCEICFRKKIIKSSFGNSSDQKMQAKGNYVLLTLAAIEAYKLMPILPCSLLLLQIQNNLVHFYVWVKFLPLFCIPLQTKTINHDLQFLSLPSPSLVSGYQSSLLAFMRKCNLSVVIISFSYFSHIYLAFVHRKPTRLNVHPSTCSHACQST